jgi:nicotinate-nucleotide pyrophosphorylase (carboxylating)
MPGLRLLDKYAVRVGGGSNHRLCLSDLLLVKNNHIDLHPGGLRGLLTQLYKDKPFYTPVEVEVRNLEEIAQALRFKPSVLMFDNMGDPQIMQALKIVREKSPQTLVEISGGVSAQRFAQLRALGVDAVSMGALTTQARNVDISMRIQSR